MPSRAAALGRGPGSSRASSASRSRSRPSRSAWVCAWPPRWRPRQRLRVGPVQLLGQPAVVVAQLALDPAQGVAGVLAHHEAHLVAVAADRVAWPGPGAAAAAASSRPAVPCGPSPAPMPMLIGPSTMPAMLLSMVNMSAPPYALLQHHHGLLAGLHLAPARSCARPGCRTAARPGCRPRSGRTPRRRPARKCSPTSSLSASARVAQQPVVGQHLVRDPATAATTPSAARCRPGRRSPSRRRPPAARPGSGPACRGRCRR